MKTEIEHRKHFDCANWRAKESCPNYDYLNEDQIMIYGCIIVGLNCSDDCANYED